MQKKISCLRKSIYWINIVKIYRTYALIPAILLYKFKLVPPGWEQAAAAVVVVSSLYCFANKRLKIEDNFFTGFPAAWNLVVLGFYPYLRLFYYHKLDPHF